MRRLPKRDLSQIQRRDRENRHPSVEDVVQQQPLPTPCSVEEQTQSQTQTTELPNLHGLPQIGGDELLVDMLEEHPFMLLGHLDMNMNMNINMTMNMGFELHSWMAIVPLTNTQMINRQQLEHSQDLTWNGRQALESALSSASRILGSMEQGTEMAETAVAEEERSIPSLEFLCWMLNDIGSDKFGPFISDYFRHIDKDTLKHMGLAILFNNASPSNKILYTVCVNSVAFKFLNATLGMEGNDDDEHELTQRLRHSALLYRETAKAALKNIALISKPSFSLLQAILCGIFLHQGSGDTNTCRELAKTACRICMDIGLHPGATDLQQVTEEEWYCFMWCYTLDRNYAWKFGGPRILTIDADPDTIINSSSPGSNIAASKLMLLYLDLAKIQDTMIPFLNDPAKAARDGAFNPVNGIATLLLRKMEIVRHDIDQIKPSTQTWKWKGLDRTSELASLDFAFHSILTNLPHPVPRRHIS